MRMRFFGAGAGGAPFDGASGVRVEREIVSWSVVSM